MSRPSPAAPRRRSRTRLYLLLLVVVAAIAGGWFYYWTRQHEQPTAITVEKAIVKTITQTVSATGKIQPEVEVKISPEVAGEIIELPFREGADVKKGDLLFRIKPDNYQAQVEQQEAALADAQARHLQAKSQLIKAEADHRRAAELFKKGLISDSDQLNASTELDIARTSVEAAAAQIRRAEGTLKQMRDLLDKTTVYSPIDGTISLLSSELGERVVGTGQFAGTEILRVANLGDMEVRVKVNENDIINVKIGDRARVTIDAFPRRTFDGTVKEIASSATTTGANTQEEVTNFEVRVRISSGDAALRPGMSASAEIETQTVENVIAVPIQSVTVRTREGSKTMEQLASERDRDAKETQGDGAATAVNVRQERERARSDRDALQRVVFIYHPGGANGTGVVQQIPVTTGIADTTHMEIKTGVKPGDEIVSGSFSAITRILKDGAAVTVENTGTGK
ncbi:efflux RND transporter periplasmic adaptor subunit [Opitutaceae bacterium TAV4]|uniref:efflux RND transporter periplasmic adaptor subunit n=1 Tax=Geminisphaera colitermitum TaxID=1148786 RepID=UPI0001964DFF|nr:efflux RND transporter periplasmic adaptor subunit [Geminisphaera colitermitum]RRJ94383.1 efflux RND transporter periplasmic adaptor subunit [Opitutaceae bacterium TAV4]RRJ98473.1 efflux RND transporter periplasmic adaptor subunit [Opitutaceae bacterium TAV3]